jgi:hypothetical protein
MSDHKPNEPKPSDFKEAIQHRDDAKSGDGGEVEQPTQSGKDERESEAHPS